MEIRNGQCLSVWCEPTWAAPVQASGLVKQRSWDCLVVDAHWSGIWDWYALQIWTVPGCWQHQPCIHETGFLQLHLQFAASFSKMRSFASLLDWRLELLFASHTIASHDCICGDKVDALDHHCFICRKGNDKQLQHSLWRFFKSWGGAFRRQQATNGRLRFCFSDYQLRCRRAMQHACWVHSQSQRIPFLTSAPPLRAFPFILLFYTDFIVVIHPSDWTRGILNKIILSTFLSQYFVVFQQLKFPQTFNSPSPIYFPTNFNFLNILPTLLICPTLFIFSTILFSQPFYIVSTLFFLNNFNFLNLNFCPNTL